MIDWTQVARLRADLGAEVFPEIAEAFLTELETQAAALDAPAAAPDIMKDRFHTMKGSALYLGFAALADACAGAERATQDHAELAPHIDRIRSLRAASAAAFRAG